MRLIFSLLLPYLDAFGMSFKLAGVFVHAGNFFSDSSDGYI